jgi:CBS-domain-containing membrane protein
MPLDEATELTVADLIHSRFSALPADATIAQVRDWFAASSHRRIAVFADGRRYAGFLTLDELGGDLDPDGRAADHARYEPTVTPEVPAHTGHRLATASPANRIPVVDHDGTLLGVVGITDDLGGFCGAK